MMTSYSDSHMYLCAYSEAYISSTMTYSQKAKLADEYQESED